MSEKATREALEKRVKELEKVVSKSKQIEEKLSIFKDNIPAFSLF